MYGSDRISITYNVVNDSTGDVESSNNRESFYIVDEALESHINAIRDYIREHKLAD